MLLVAFGHAGVGAIQGGYVGVDVFFVLSGFFITGLLLANAKKTRTVSFVDFYIRRAKRILPAAALTLVVTDLAAYELLNFVRAKQALWDSVSATFFVANVHFASLGTDYFAEQQPPSPVQHYWSLAVEEQFYVVWPAVLALVLIGLRFRSGGRRLRSLGEFYAGLDRLLVVASVAFAASLAWSIYDTHAHQASAYFSTLTRSWELALGALIAIGSTRLAHIPARVRLIAGYAGLLAIAAAAALFTRATPFPGYAALLPTVGAAMVIVAGIGTDEIRGAAGRLLSVRPMRYVGDRSYTLYLWHWPVLIIAEQYEGHKLSLPVNLLLLAAAFGLSIFTYSVFENPIRKADWSNGAVSTFAVASIAVAFFAAALPISRINSKIDAQAARAAPVPAPIPIALPPTSPSIVAGSPRATSGAADGALPIVVRSVKNGNQKISVAALSPPVGKLLDDRYQLAAGCFADQGATSSRICRLGSTSGRRVLAVLGDSHAQMWLPAILALAERDRWTVIPLVKFGCLPELWVASSGSADCRQWLPWAIATARSLHPDVLLISGEYSASNGSRERDAAAGIAKVAEGVGAAARRIVAMIDVPGKPGLQPVDCLLRPGATGNDCSTRLDGPAAVPDGEAYDAIASTPRVSIIDPTPWLCYDNSCPTVIGNTIAYRDANHITATYATELAAPFRAAFMRAISSHAHG